MPGRVVAKGSDLFCRQWPVIEFIAGGKTCCHQLHHQLHEAGADVFLIELASVKAVAGSDSLTGARKLQEYGFSSAPKLVIAGCRVGRLDWPARRV